MKEANKLYLVMWIACLAGYGWLYYATTHPAEPVGICMFKQVTHIPCPSCGTTRAVVSLTQGNFTGGFLLNPLCYIVAGIMLLFPLWMLRDLLTGQHTLYKTYLQVEKMIKQPGYAIPLVVLIIANWVWTITKGL